MDNASRPLMPNPSEKMQVCMQFVCMLKLHDFTSKPIGGTPNYKPRNISLVFYATYTAATFFSLMYLFIFLFILFLR
uniref:Uncharacterized protein n=1 Tax=Anguilla anguilla TaxID=7936 RepID=A0A0E9TZP8_ANGAN